MEYPLQYRSHKVERLDIHLPGQWRKDDAEVEDEDLADVPQKRSKLDSFFALVKSEIELEKNDKTKEYKSLAKTLCYHEVPLHYTWHGNSICEFKPKGREVNRIGRVYFVQPNKRDLFYLRYVILHNISIITNLECSCTMFLGQHASTI